MRRPIPARLSPNVQGLGQSATVAINQRSDALRAAGRRIIKLGLGQSPFPVPPAVVEALRQNAHQKDYLPTQGLPALREAVAAFTARRSGVARGAQDVLIGPGSKELMFLLQLCFDGELLIPAPSWVSYAPQARIIGRQVRWLDTAAQDGWRLRPETLEAACASTPDLPRVLILNYPNNPTGLSYDDEQLAALASVARRHGVLVLSDEIYGELEHRGAYRSMAPRYPEGTIISSGLSKWCGAGGWRLGTFVFPPELAWLREAMTAVASETFTATAAPIQHASVVAFEGGAALEDYLERQRRILAALGRWCALRLQQAGIDCDLPEGGFYLMPSFEGHGAALRARGITTGAALCERLLTDTGVATLPGSSFGRPDGELIARLAYVDFDGSAALEAAAPGVALDEAWLRARCGDVLEAMALICAWVEGQPPPRAEPC